MPIEHTCPSCQIRLRVPDESAGKKVRCKCGAVSSVTPAASSPASEPARPAARQATATATAASTTSQAILLTCSACRQMLRAPQSAAGKAVRCKCGQVIQVPGLAAAVAAPPAAARRPAPAKPPVQAKVPTVARPVAATATAATASPAVAGPSTSPRAATAPTPTRAAAAAAQTAAHPANPFGSIFDELTDADWHRESPIKRAYAPPTVAKDGAVLKQFVGQELKTSRVSNGSIPVGLILLSVLNFIGSALYIFAGVAVLILVQVASVMEQLQAVFPAIALAASIFCVYIVVWGIYLSVVGVGLLQRAPWGWCVAGVSYANALVDKAYGVVSTIMQGVAPPQIVGSIGAMMVIIGITSYIYKAETRKHFGVKTLTPVIICAAIGGILAIVTLVGIEIMAHSAKAMIPEDANAG